MEDKLDIYTIEDEIAHLQSLGTFKKPKLLMISPYTITTQTLCQMKNGKSVQQNLINS